MTRRTGLSLLLLALLALGASSAAAVIHYHLLLDRTYHSACDINATWSCSQVYESQYGAFRGVPVAVGGVVWAASVTLLVVAGLALGRRAAEFAARVPGYVFALAVPGLSVVLYLAYASLFVLKTYCIFCLITYVAVAGIFLVSGAAADGSMTDLPRNARRDLQVARWLAPRPAGLGPVRRGRGGARRAVPAPGGRHHGGGRRAGAAQHRTADRVRPLVRGAAARAGRRADRRREGADRQVQRLPVPAVPDDMGTVQASHRQVPEHVSRQGEVRGEGLTRWIPNAT